nr:uncharacterized protein LOC127321906 isoform X1 [Lolium perenne]XP_051206823.1 uncharacterized protein LOC127321906 isoform X1 [Lolium perenne]
MATADPAPSPLPPAAASTRSSISMEEEMLSRVKQSLMIHIIEQVISSLVVDRCPRRSEIQSVALAKGEGRFSSGLWLSNNMRPQRLHFEFVRFTRLTLSNEFMSLLTALCLTGVLAYTSLLR